MKKIAITGGSGNIAYSLLFRIAHGDLYGPNTPVALHLLDVEEMLPSLKGVLMELEDCAFPLLKEIKIGSDPWKMFEGVDLAILVGAKPRGPGMERRDLLIENGKIFVEQGAALNDVAHSNCKVLVVGNPCNTNCWIARSKAPKLPSENFFAMTRLDQNRAKALLAQKASVQIDDVKKMAIWGNHSATQVPDYSHAEIGGKPCLEVIENHDWLKNDFIQRVQQRGAEVIKARGKSSAASAASAIVDTVKSFEGLQKDGDWFSLAVNSTGNPYGIRDDLIFSFPCLYNEGKIEIVEGLEWEPFLEDKIRMTEKELMDEQDQVLSFAR